MGYDEPEIPPPDRPVALFLDLLLRELYPAESSRATASCSAV